MTGQTLLDTMEILNAELQLQSGETDVTKGLLALNLAQDYFESLAAARGKIGGSKTGTIVTASSTETTTFPTGVLRIDRIQLLDATTSRPKRELTPIRRAGGHAIFSAWPVNLVLTTSTGEPTGYWTDKTNVYWTPLPDGVYTLRWYGFQRASDITASGTFAYDDVACLPLAAFAVQLIKGGLDDSAQDAIALATQTFKPVLDLLSNVTRDGATGMEYTAVHNE